MPYRNPESLCYVNQILNILGDGLNNSACYLLAVIVNYGSTQNAFNQSESALLFACENRLASDSF